MQRRVGIMLAMPFEQSRLARWKPPYLVQPKLDGDRCRAIIDNEGKVTLLSSEAHVKMSVPHISEALKRTGYRGIELDGELYKHGRSHQELRSVIGRSKNLHTEYEEVEFHIFDIFGGELQMQRTLALDKLELECPLIRVSTRSAESLEEVMSIMEEYTEDGYEGIVVRNAYYPYLRKRSTGMMKFKPRKEDIYTIIGFEEEISIHNEPKNALGALVLQSDLGHQFKVGSGSFLTRERRKELWQIKESLIGRLASVKYQHLTERRVPRFPVLINIL